jgi:hypothetical protein
VRESTDWQWPDVLSKRAREAIDVRSDAYARLTPTGGGSIETKALLARLRPDDLLSVPVKRPEDARAMLAGLWLYHDWLDESHAISQELHSPTGSFWHAIMHRREGDFSNAKYWYARCRRHPALGAIAAQARALVDGLAARDTLHRLVRHEWDPDGFVDVVEAIHHKPDDPLYAAAVRLQHVEWNVLFAHCAAAAAGR